MPITAYTFPRRKGSQFHFALTIVVVPAFGCEVPPATSATEHLLSRITGIFPNCFDKLHGIAYVINASMHALPRAQLDVLKSMRSIFGDDVHKNLFILNTFADCREPLAVKALHDADIQFQQSFKFNCSPMLPAKSGEADIEAFDWLNWKMSETSTMRFLECIADIKSVNLQSPTSSNPEQ